MSAASPPGGLAGLPGTTVEVDAQSNRPLAGGNVSITEARLQLRSVAMSGSGNEATGSFVINAPGKFNLTLADIKGQSSTDSFAGTISLLADEKPFVRILQPPSTSFANPGRSDQDRRFGRGRLWHFAVANLSRLE